MMTAPLRSLAPTAPLRHDAMRIAGRKVDTDERLDIVHPYSGRVIGSVPRGRAEHARDAICIGHGFKSKLTRYERQRILLTAAGKLSARKNEIARVIPAESGLSLKDSLYEVGRAYDVFTLAGQLAIHDDGEIFSCDITPHGKPRRIFTMRQPLLLVITATPPSTPPPNRGAHKTPPATATNNRVVLKPAEVTPLTALLLADVLYEAGLP